MPFSLHLLLLVHGQVGDIFSPRNILGQVQDENKAVDIPRPHVPVGCSPGSSRLAYEPMEGVDAAVLSTDE